MKKQLQQKTMLTALIAVMGISLFAQVEIIFEPANLIPADTGYYIMGVDKDKDGNGIPEHYDGCMDEYGDSEHREADKQQGFTYNKSMVMPDCWPKDAVVDNSLAEIDHAKGYIELTKSKYPDTDSASLGYIITPSISNLVSLTLELSPDVSVNAGRTIEFWIEFSTDNGESWNQEIYVADLLIQEHKKGEVKFYDGIISQEFDDIKKASAISPIVLRIMSKPLNKEYTSQRLKVHYIKIIADKASAINNVASSDLSIKVLNNVISSESSKIEVFNTLGQKMGVGTSVTVKSGVYIVRTETGETQKILVK